MNLLKKIIIPLSILMMTVYAASSQESTYVFYHKTFTTDDGLSSRFVQNIYQDSRNFIWIGSDYGVNRFDGQTFKVYNQGRYNLRSDNVNEIREDQQGNLWFINRRLYVKNKIEYIHKVNIDVLNHDKDKIVPFEEYIGGPLPFEMSSIVSIEQDEFYVVWVTTNDGKLYRYTDKFVEVHLDDNLLEHAIVYPVLDSMFLVIRPGEIIKLNASLEIVFQTEFKDRIKEIFPSKDGYIYFTNVPDKIPYQLDEQGNLSQLSAEDPFRAKRFGADSKGRVWAETSNSKIILFDKGVRVLDENLDKFTLGETFNYRSDFFGDKNGGIWFGDRNGLNYLSLNQTGFTSYLEEGIVSMREFFELSDSTLFLNSYRGYFILNTKTGYYESFELPGHVGYSQGGIMVNGFLYNSLYSHEVAKINLEEQTVSYMGMNDPYTNPKTFVLAPDSSILIGSTSGLYLLDPQIDTITPFKKYNEFKELKTIVINSFKHVDNMLYVLTEKGLYVLDWKKGIVDHHNFSFNNLLYLHVDEDGIFWIATRGGGIFEWDPKRRTIHQYTTEEGLSHDIVYAVYGDTLNQLWLPSSKGLMQFNKINKTVVTYLKGNGILDNEFNQYAHCQDSKGKIYMGGINGLVGFNPIDFSTDEMIRHDSKIVVTEITVSQKNNKTYQVPTFRINNGEMLVLKGDVQTTNMRFSLLEYDRLEYRQYYYKIEGIHDRWQIMNDQYVRLAGLPGGTHKILIKVNAGINMATHYASVKVQILKPFTQSNLFFVLCAIGFIIIGISLSRYRIYRLDQINRSLERKVRRRTKKIENDRILISQQYREMEQINKTKDHLIAIIGHDLKDYVSTFEGIEQKINYLISSKQVERIPQLAEFIENSAHDLSLLLDNLLNWALKERGDLLLHPDSVSVQSILQDVLKRLDKSIAKKEIALLNEIPPDLNIYVDGLTLHSLLRNIIHNAIKFSYRKGVIKIYHKEEGDLVTIYIEDHGIGIEQEQMERLLTDSNAATSTRGTENEIGTGMGLLLCREMLEMQSGTLNISSKVGVGTTFSINLPKKTSSANLEVISV